MRPHCCQIHEYTLLACQLRELQKQNLFNKPYDEFFGAAQLTKSIKHLCSSKVFLVKYYHLSSTKPCNPQRVQTSEDNSALADCQYGRGTLKHDHEK